MTKKAVIIGGGISGIYVMRNLLEKRGATKEDLNITLIKRENTGWVSVCGLPYALRGWYEIDKVVINDDLEKAVDEILQTVGDFLKK